MGRVSKKRIWITAAGILFLILLMIGYRVITPQDRFFIRLKESDIEKVLLYGYRTLEAPMELTDGERQKVIEQLLGVSLKGGWTVLDVLNGGTTVMYHIVLTDGQEFDFCALPNHEMRPNGTLRPCPYYIINGMRAYEASKSDMELVEQIDAYWRELSDQYFE